MGTGGGKRVLRGSSLFLVGRLISIGVNFAVQVLAVRYLAKGDYGAFAWALAVASMGASMIQLGLQRGVSRFVPIHHEHGEHDRMFGTMALAIATIAGLGLAVVALVIGARALGARLAGEELSAGLLVILIGLAPTQALDNLFQGLCAVFAGARAIFMRRYIIGPGLRLAAVLLVIGLEGSVQMLAAAYMAAGVIGIAIYVTLLWKVLRRQGLLEKLDPRTIKLPVRSLFGFSLPLISTDLMLVFETTVMVMLLERIHGTEPVASLRAVVPAAGLCLVVIQSIKLLFRPQAARFFARNDERGLGDLYWRSAGWVTVASFPIFALCVFLAQPVTVALFGEDYRSSGVILAVLAAGKYFNAAVGLNTFTLQVYARVKLITLINAISAAIGLGLGIWLISRHGALGAAIAGTTILVLRNGLYQAALMATTRIGRPPRSALVVYGWVIAGIACLSVVVNVTDDPAIIAGSIAAAAIALAWINRRTLEIGETFPELRKVPMMRWFC